MARIGDDVSRQRQRLVVPVSFTLIAVLVAALLIAPTASEMFFNGSTTATILIALAIILLPLWLVCHAHEADARAARRIAEGVCHRCGYPLGPTESTHCPECGAKRPTPTG